MNPFVLLLLGLAIVLGGILWLRLHAFLALMLGACVVGGLTSAEHLQQAMAVKFRGEITRAAVDEEVGRQIDKRRGTGESIDPGELRAIARELVDQRRDEIDRAALARADEFRQNHSTLSRITQALGSTCGKIGLLIAMACVIGRCLLASGGAERIVRATLSLVGEKGAPLAFSFSSFFLGIPVFFDSVFLLSIPLAKATWLKLRKNYLLFVLALVTGGTMTHSLVPPTPGPLFVAEELGVNMGTMILMGMAVGVCCSAVGLLFAYWVNGRFDIPVRETPEEMERLSELARRRIDELPSLGVSLLPVLLPVLLIGGATIYRSLLGPAAPIPDLVELLGDKNMALSVSAAAAMWLAAMRLRDKVKLAEQVQQAMQEAGLIILICCAGGAFGAMLQQSGIGPMINRMTSSDPLDFGLLPLAFVVTTVIRGAQGSSTVAMFTGVAIVSSLAPDLDALSYHPVYLALAIGCGSKPFPWMNDSGFWVISRISGMSEQETLKTHTPMVTLMGFTGILVTLLAAWLMPMR